MRFITTTILCIFLFNLVQSQELDKWQTISKNLSFKDFRKANIMQVVKKDADVEIKVSNDTLVMVSIQPVGSMAVQMGKPPK